MHKLAAWAGGPRAGRVLHEILHGMLCLLGMSCTAQHAQRRQECMTPGCATLKQRMGSNHAMGGAEGAGVSAWRRSKKCKCPTCRV